MANEEIKPLANEGIKLPTKKDVIFAAMTGLFGGLGGLVVCFLNSDWSLNNFILSVIVGYVGVILLNVDRTDIHRLLVGAFFCGMYPKPLLETGKQFIDRHQAVKNSEGIASSALRLPSKTGDQLAVGIQEIAERTKQAIASTSNLKNPTTLGEVDSNLTFAITGINRVAEKEPEQAIKALSELRLTAKQSGNSRLGKQIETSLKRISLDPSQSEKVHNSAKQAIANIPDSP